MMEYPLPKGKIVFAIVRVVFFIPAIAIIIITGTRDDFSDIQELVLTIIAFFFSLIAITGAAKLALIPSGTN